MAVGRRPLRSTDDLRASLKDLRGTQLLVVLRRERRMLTVKIPLEPLTALPSQPTPEPKPAPTRPGEPGFLGVFLSPERQGAGGARIDGTQNDSPARRAGLREGDLVLSADGRRVTDTQAFVAFLRTKRAGDTLRLLVHRRGQHQTVRVTLSRRGEPTPGAGPGWLGAALEMADGRVKVVELAPDGPAAEAGLRAGDVLLRANDQPLSTLDDLGAILSRHTAGQTVRLHVERNGWTKSLSVTLAARP
jgi:S1-C subfamily serine protease